MLFAVVGVALTSNTALGQELRLSGHVGTAIQVRATGCANVGNCRLLNFRNTNVVGLKIDAAPSSSTELVADLVLRNINFHRIETLDDTGSISKVQPVDVRINEARMTLLDLFGVDGLDLAAGALRVPWGTADGINPLDRVNPFDLENGTGFDKRLSSPAIQLGWTIGPVRVEALMIPLFVPAILPVDEIDFTAMGAPEDVFDLSDGEEGDPVIVRVQTPTTAPSATLKNVQAGARVVWNSAIGDFSTVFYRGFETLPQASGEARLAGFQTSSRVDLGVPLVYPKITMAGFDYRGPIGDRLSAWAEVAFLFPESAELTAAKHQLESLVKLGHLDEVPSPLPVQETQSDTMYVNAVAGIDYTFPGDLYANLQYARGMPTERQASDLHDYVLMALRWPLLEGRLTLEARGALEIGDDALGYSASGSVTWLHGDAAELELAVRLMDGQDGTTFQRFESLSHMRLSFSLGF